MTPGTKTAGRVEIVLTVDGKEYRREINQAVAQMGGLEQKANLSAAAFSKLRTSLGAAFGAGVAAAVGRAIYDTAKSFESLNAQLLTSEKTQARAQVAFDRIREFAATTPYELEQVTEAYIRLRNLGLDPSTKALTAYGNIAGGMGKSLNQVIEAVADASTFEFERLKEFGIKARQQGDQVSFTFQGVTTTVAKNAADIERYLQGIGEVNFAGGMERQAKTLEGVASNLGDALAALALKVDGETGFSGAIKRSMSTMAEWINQLAGVPRSLGTIAGEIAEVERKLAALPITGRASAGRGPLQGRLAELRDEQLRSQIRSTDAGAVSAAEQALQQQRDALQSQLDASAAGSVARRGRRTMSAEQVRINRELTETVGLLQQATVQRERLASAAAAEADERARVDADGAAAKAAAALDAEAKAREKLLKAEEQLAFNEAKRQQDLLEADAKRTEELREQIALRRQAARDVSLRAGRTLDLQGYAPEDQQRIGELQGLADRYDQDQQALDDYYAGQLEKQAEYQDASRALLEAYRADEERIHRQRRDDAVGIDAEGKAVLLQQTLGFGRDAAALLQVFAGETKAVQLGLLGFEKALAIAEIIIQTQLGAAKAVGQLGPFGLPLAAIIEGVGAARVALVAATGVAQAAQIQNGGGRERGGPVRPGSMYEVGERGRPELLESGGRYYLIPGNQDGTVRPATATATATAAGQGMPRITVINPPGVPLVAEARYVSRDEMQVQLRAAVGAAVGAVVGMAQQPGSALNAGIRSSNRGVSARGRA